MMSTTKIIQYIHRPNNTELGKGNTHESYMLIPSNIDVSSIFPSSVEVVVTDSISGKKYRLKSASGKEFRVNQMGDFYRDYSVNQGDEIIITNVNNGTDNKRFISIRKFERVAIITSSKGSEIINIEKLDDCKQSDGSYHITLYQNGMYSTMKISFLSSQRKRSDSPNTTDYYDVAINGNPITVGTHYITLGLKNTFSDLQKCEYSEVEFDDLNFLRSFIPTGNVNTKPHIVPTLETTPQFLTLLTALRTKPFILLAGISGTGKSQKVQELAFMTCPKGELRNEGGTTPGNYCLLEVKPNWHDSTELLGYYSVLTHRYELKDFIRFVYKAHQHKDVPFFLCLDEMNLAPVEQYFAEFLSVLETRKKVGNEIKTEPLLKKEVFVECKLEESEPKEKKDVVNDDSNNYEITVYSDSAPDRKIIEYLKENGLTIPDNLFVIGTVNMDDTTHQFSRKVIDRAFTIEMNGGKMKDMFSPESKALLNYREKPVPLTEFKSEFVRAYEVLDDDRFRKYTEIITSRIPKLLGDSECEDSENSINGILANTPFRVSYRVQNELVLYLSTLIERANYPAPDKIDNLIAEATLAILLQKILPRIQGEQKQLETKNGNILKDLKTFVESHFKPQEEQEDKTLYTSVIKKLNEMDTKLNNYYTNFF